jgi:hypothetical protein
MGTIKLPAPVKLMIAVMSAPGTPADKARSRLVDRFGPTDLSYGPVPFSWTDYYEPEMGKGLFKSYYSFQKYIDRSEIPAIKIFTNNLESEFASEGKRSINCDPGYIARDKLVLASTKDFYHRMYLSDGIYGEVTLHYRKGEYRFFSWTYPDYREQDFLDFLESARALLVRDLRDGAGNGLSDV